MVATKPGLKCFAIDGEFATLHRPRTFPGKVSQMQPLNYWIICCRLKGKRHSSVIILTWWEHGVIEQALYLSLSFAALHTSQRGLGYGCPEKGMPTIQFLLWWIRMTCPLPQENKESEMRQKAGADLFTHFLLQFISSWIEEWM